MSNSYLRGAISLPWSNLVALVRQVVASLVYDKMEISTEDPNTPWPRHVCAAVEALAERWAEYQGLRGFTPLGPAVQIWAPLAP